MVLKAKRHLSLLLVVILATSWLFLPLGPVRAQTSTSIDVAPAAYQLKSGYQFSYVNDPSKPTSIVFSWNQQNGNSSISKVGLFLVVTGYEIQFLPSVDARNGVSIQTCLSSPDWQSLATVNETNAVPRIVRTVEDGRSKITSPSYFRVVAVSRLGDRINPPIPLTCGIKTIDPYFSGNNQVQIQFTSAPVGATVTIGGRSLQEVAGQTKSTTPVTIVTSADSNALATSRTVLFHLNGYKDCSVNTTFDINKLINAQLASNSSSDQSTCSTTDSTGAAAGGAESLATVLQRLFDPKSSGATFKLQDDNLVEINPTKPPKVVVTATTVSKPLTFTLKFVRGVAGGFWHNNYFLFALTDYPDDLKNSIDVSKLYLAIDLAGNIGFVQEDNNKSIFSTEEKNLDDNIVLGKFDADNRVSPYLIDLTDYKNVITSRVYNERLKDFTPDWAKVTEIATIFVTAGGALLISPQLWTQAQQAACDASPEGRITFGKTNKTYDLYPPKNAALKGIPDSDHRQCINADPEGWLAKWGIKFNKVDAAVGDKTPCDTMFKGSDPFAFFSNFVGKNLCNLVYAMVGMATWFAGWTVDFLLLAVGLQS